MSTHVEWTAASRLSVKHFRRRDLPKGWDVEDAPVEARVLVLEDAGNCLAFVIEGTPDELLRLAAEIADLADPDDTPEVTGLHRREAMRRLGRERPPG